MGKRLKDRWNLGGGGGDWGVEITNKGLSFVAVAVVVGKSRRDSFREGSKKVTVRAFSPGGENKGGAGNEKKKLRFPCVYE